VLRCTCACSGRRHSGHALLAQRVVHRASGLAWTAGDEDPEVVNAFHGDPGRVLRHVLEDLVLPGQDLGAAVGRERVLANAIVGPELNPLLESLLGEHGLELRQQRDRLIADPLLFIRGHREDPPG
jgi:hypothetical protein